MNLLDYVHAVRSTAKLPETDVNYFLVGLAGEVGEVMNQWQKILRGDDPASGLRAEGSANQSEELVVTYQISDERRARLIEELGGVAWFWTAACLALGHSPESVLAQNAMKLASRQKRGVIKGDGDAR